MTFGFTRDLNSRVRGESPVQHCHMGIVDSAPGLLLLRPMIATSCVDSVAMMGTAAADLGQIIRPGTK